MRFEVPEPEIVYGLPIAGIPADCIPVGVVVLVKAVKINGDVTYFEVSSPDLSPMEQVGMTVTYTDTLRQQLMVSRHRST
jgi:hypothetical protein